MYHEDQATIQQAILKACKSHKPQLNPPQQREQMNDHDHPHKTYHSRVLPIARLLKPCKMQPERTLQIYAS
eukprot:5014315-Amphidinium_carterae.1